MSRFSSVRRPTVVRSANPYRKNFTRVASLRFVLRVPRYVRRCFRVGGHGDGPGTKPGALRAEASTRERNESPRCRRVWQSQSTTTGPKSAILEIERTAKTEEKTRVRNWEIGPGPPSPKSTRFVLRSDWTHLPLPHPYAKEFRFVPSRTALRNPTRCKCKSLLFNARVTVHPV